MIAILCSLCCCAPVRTEIPSSLPFVVIDETIPGTVISRRAAEALAVRRSLERAEWAKKMIDEQTKSKLLEQRLEQQTKRANANEWWGRNGLSVTLGSSLAATALSVAITLLFGGRK